MHTILRRKRQRSIRVLLAAIFVVPLVSLLALWGFAASVTVVNAVNEHNFKRENDLYGGSAQGLGVQLSNERLIAYEYLSSGRRMPEQAFLAQIAVTNKALKAFWVGLASGPGMFQSSSWPALKSWEAQLGKPLAQVRAEVESGRISPLAAFDAYDNITNAQFAVYSQLITVNNSELYRQAAASIEAGRALELAESNAALIEGAFAAGGYMTTGEKQLVSQFTAQQNLLFPDAINQLNPNLGSGYRKVTWSQTYKTFQGYEDAIINSIGTRGPIPVTPQAFALVAKPLFAAFLGAEMQDRDGLTAQGTRVSDQLLLEVGLAGGVGLLAVVLSIFLMVRFGRRISRELTGLQRAALELAENRLPSVVSRLSEGEDVDVAAEATPIEPGRIAETARVAEAFSSVQRTAVEAAVGQARMRRGVSQVFRNLAWRSQSLLHRQLGLLDKMERKQTEPETLDELFQLDHLTTRMRRHAEGLIILSGATPGRGWRDPVPVLDVMRGAIAEVEDYKRVTVISDSQDAVIGTAVADVIHLLAELIENATTYSPASTEVTLRAERVANGFVAEIEDRGIGISAIDLAAFNSRLESTPEFDLADSNQLGLFVVGRLAAKHHISVTLRRSPYGGTSAIVLLPNAIMALAEQPSVDSFDAFRAALPAASPSGPFDPFGPGDAADLWKGAGVRNGGSRRAPGLRTGVGPVGTGAGHANGGASNGGPLYANGGGLSGNGDGLAPNDAQDGNGAAVHATGDVIPVTAEAAAEQPDEPPVSRRAPYLLPEQEQWMPQESVWDVANPAATAPEDTAAQSIRPWLPRRQRQASLAPELREDTRAGVQDSAADASDGPSPAGSRALVESLQYGLDLARVTPTGSDDPWPTDPWSSGDAWPSPDSWRSESWPPPGRSGPAAAPEDAEGQ